MPKPTTAWMKEVPQIYLVKGQIETVRRNFDQAVRYAEHAIRIKPSYADAHALLAWILHFAGRPRDGLVSVERTVHLNPRVPSIDRMVRGALHYSMGDIDSALADLRPAAEVSPSFQPLRIRLAAAYAAGGWRRRIGKLRRTSPSIPSSPFPPWNGISPFETRSTWNDSSPVCGRFSGVGGSLADDLEKEESMCPE